MDPDFTKRLKFAKHSKPEDYVITIILKMSSTTPRSIAKHSCQEYPSVLDSDDEPADYIEYVRTQCKSSPPPPSGCSMMLVDIQRTNATADAFEFLRRLEEVNELGYLNLQPRELFVVRT